MYTRGFGPSSGPAIVDRHAGRTSVRRATPVTAHDRLGYNAAVLNRLFASVAILSLLVGLFTLAIWWRADHGTTDTFHLGADSATQTWFETLPGGRLAAHIAEKNPTGVRSRTDFLPLRSVLGGCLFIPALWAAVQLRRRLLPRPPGSELPALGRR